MSLSNFLLQLDRNRIDISVENSELLVRVEENTSLVNNVHEYIQVNKKVIIKRLLNNSFAQSRGWIVANYGEVYCYQYSSTGYLFIERNEDETVDVYRCKFGKDYKAINIKGLQKNIPFSKAYQKSKSFLKWFYRENHNLNNRKY